MLSYMNNPQTQYNMSIKEEYYKQSSKNTNEEESLPFVNFVENT